MIKTGEGLKTNTYRDKLRHQDFDVEVKEVDVDKEIQEFPLHVYGERVYVVEEVVSKVGSLYVPETAQRGGEMQTNIGFVVGCGPDCRFVKLRDKIFYARYSGSWIFDQKYRVMNEEDILGVFKEDASPNGAEEE